MRKDNIIWVVLGGIGLAMVLNKRASAIGKLNDVNPRGGGRIDRHWNRDLRYEVHPMQTLGRNPKPHFEFYFDPESLVKTFDLYGIEFGNWMNEQDRLDFFFATAVSLRDIAKVFEVPFKKIGRGRLSIALGARGQGGFAAAHYERRAYWAINLTKTAGKGSLVHEYGHFLDNVLGVKFKKGDFLSGGRSVRKDVRQANLKGKRGAVYHMEMVFKILYWKSNGEPTNYYHEQMRETEYYQRRTEVWARTIEAYTHLQLKSKSIRNDWLVSRNPQSDWPPLDLVRKAFPHIRALIKMAY